MQQLRNAAAGRAGTRRASAGIAVPAIVPILLGTCIGLLVCGGCAANAAGGRGARAGSPGLTRQGGDGPRIGPAELDELTRAFADRYVGLLSSTCDALKGGNPDPVQRREAQDLVLNCAANFYDIAQVSLGRYFVDLSSLPGNGRYVVRRWDFG